MRLFIIGFLTGVFGLQQMAALPFLNAPFTIAGCLTALALTLHIRNPSRGAAVVKAALALLIGTTLGFAYADWRATERLSEELPRVWEGKDIEAVGVITSLPIVNERGTRFEFRVEQIPTPNAFVPRNISLTWYPERERKGQAANPQPVLHPGERWHLTVRLRRPHGTQNPHGYDFEAFALERGIRATGYVRANGVHVRKDEFVEGFANRIEQARFAIRENMQNSLGNQPFAGVLIALTIGEQNAIPGDQWRTFWRTGVGHLMSISGLHITMVASLMYWLTFRLWSRIPAFALRLPAQRIAALTGAATALAYSLIAGFSVPTQRTFFMLAVVAAALWTGKTTSASRILALAMLVVLLIDPWAVLAPGFWLSFGAVATIFFVTLNRRNPASAVREAVTMQAAVTLGLLPMTMILFQEVSLVSPLANAFAIPIVSLGVVPITLLGALFPTSGLLDLAHTIMSDCYWALNALSVWSGAVWQSHAPTQWTAGLSIVGCLCLMLPRGSVPRWPAPLLMLPMFWVVPASPAQGAFWATVLDVGQGLSVVVRTQHHALVYDTGPRFTPDSDAGNRIVVPFLRGEGIRALDALVVSHADEDHSGGAKSIIDARSPQWILTSTNADHAGLQGANEVIRCDRRDGWHWDGVDFDILHPSRVDYEDEHRKINNLGCVLKVSSKAGSILLPADIERKGESELLERETADLKADVLVVPHHGSKTSSTEAFIDAVSPKLAIFSMGYRNRFRHPHPDISERYQKRHIDTLRTDETGAITLFFSPNSPGKPRAEMFRNRFARYWIDQPIFLTDSETH